MTVTCRNGTRYSSVVRIDDSRGPGGGFFRGAEVPPGGIALTPTQNLLILGVILTFDSHFQP
jgi:hypothetical protein